MNETTRTNKIVIDGASTPRAPMPAILQPACRAANVIQETLQVPADSPASLIEPLRQLVGRAASGDFIDLEEQLAAQIVTLGTVFDRLVRAHCHYTGEGSHQLAEQSMRLALKAQGQAREATRTLAEMKRPPSIQIEQANIAHGHQQVNNVPVKLGGDDGLDA